MSEPTPWRECPHRALRLVACRLVKDPGTALAPLLSAALKAHLTGGTGYRVAVCARCGMRWHRVQRVRRGRDPWTNQPVK